MVERILELLVLFVFLVVVVIFLLMTGMEIINIFSIKFKILQIFEPDLTITELVLIFDRTRTEIIRTISVLV